MSLGPSSTNKDLQPIVQAGKPVLVRSTVSVHGLVACFAAGKSKPDLRSFDRKK